MGREDKIIEDAPFEVEAFDEKEYIRKELISFRSTVVLFVLSLLVAFASFLIWRNMDLVFAAHMFVAIGFGALVVRFLFKAVKIDVSHWKRKEWVGTMFLYFFFWLGFFLLLTNPPITDAAPPAVELAASPRVQALGQPIELGAYISDNVRVREETVVFCITKVSGTTPTALSNLSAPDLEACRTEWVRAADSAHWNFTFTPRENGTYAVIVEAGDAQGLTGRHSLTFEAGSPFRILDPPGPNDNSEFVDSGQTFRACPKAALDVRSIQYAIDAGPFNNFAEDKNEAGCWQTSPRFPGWNAGRQSVTVRVVEQPTFLTGGFRVGGGIAVDPNGPWTVSVSREFAGLNSEKEPAFAERVFIPPGQTPALGVPVLLLAAFGLAFARRRSPDA